MKKTGRFKISTQRHVEIWRTMIETRRELFRDDQFFKMPEALEKICNVEEESSWRINRYPLGPNHEYKIRAGVTVLGHKVKFAVSDPFWEFARNGRMQENFILAHELGHVALDHHRTAAVVKNFQLFSTENGTKANIPPTKEELEANYGAVYFQCGVALFDTRRTAYDLAKIAFSDRLYVEKARRLISLQAFQDELARPRKRYPRVIL